MNKRMLMISIGLLALVVAVLAFAQSQSARASTAVSASGAAAVLAQDDGSADSDAAAADDGTDTTADDATAADDAADAAAAPETVADTGEATSFAPVNKTFATVNLNAGFLLDPYLLRVLGGGLQPAADLNADCAGYVQSTPNASLNWTGTSAALSVFVYSDADPVLVIETPDGDFLCDDDASSLVLDPMVTIDAPAEGAYNIYVGSAELGGFHTGFLVFTEMTTDLASLDLVPLLDRRDAPVIDNAVATGVAALQYEESSIFGTIDIGPGFDTVKTLAAGGGAIPIHNLPFIDGSCTGFASIIPSYSFVWSGTGSGLTVYLEAQADSTLVVRTPDGEFVCSDNVSADNFNPSVAIANPTDGEYDIYIAAPTFNDVIPGILTITAEPNAVPSAPASISQ